MTMEGDMVSAVIPDTISGQSYTFITNAVVAASASIMDSTVLFGPVLLRLSRRVLRLILLWRSSGSMVDGDR